MNVSWDLRQLGCQRWGSAARHYPDMVEVFSAVGEAHRLLSHCPEILVGIGLVNHWNGAWNPSRDDRHLEAVKDE